MPKTDWDSARAKVPSLNNVTLGPSGSQAGWTVDDANQVGVQDVGPADGGLGLHHAGVQSTADRSCLDHTNSLGAGTPLLAGSDCPVTWGSEGWRGARPVPSDVFKTRFSLDPANFEFDFWKVTDAELTAAGVAPPAPGSPGKTIGNFQTYGYTSDHTGEILCGSSSILSYGNIIPASSPTVAGGCSGNPIKPGWPLGITVRFDLFTFQLPALKEIVYVQALVINNSRDVYGTPLNYDSLYIDLGHDWYHTEQRTMVYDVPQQGALYAVRGPIRPCQAIREVVDLTCATWGAFASSSPGFISGALSLIMLRSPIGDLRNKLFTKTASGAPCTPGIGFCSPGNVHAGDTLTYNHHHLCGFRACSAVTDRVTYITPQFERWAFGLISSTEENIIAGRPGGSSGFGGTIAGQRYWHVFRDAGFGTGSPDCFPGENPTLGMCWNRMAPSGWDYNHDGIPDTLHLDGCFLNGCAGLWGDSLPAIAGANGRMPTYSNSNAVMGVGPIKLNAGDTTAFVYALTQGKDSASIMIQTRAAIDNYMNFFLAPDAAPKCHLVGVQRAPVAAGAQISFAWDDACFAGKWTDKFLAKQFADLVAADPNSPVGIVRRLNPWLKDTLLFLSTHNLKRLYVFKSCDGGNTWASTTTCASTPATGGSLKDVGFLPYATFNTDDPSGIPSHFSDLNVQGGLTYTYNLIGETRGAAFQVVNGDSTTVNPAGDTVCAKNCRAETLSIAPVLFNGLTGSTSNPNVARVYLAVSRQGGGAQASVTATATAGPMPANRIGFTTVSDSLTPATFTVAFGDSAHATQIEVFNRSNSKLRSRLDSLVLVKGTTAQAAVVSTTIYDTVGPAKVDTIRFGGLTPSGATVAAAVGVTVSDSTVTTQYVWASGPVMALVRIENKAKAVLLTGGPLLVSNTLSGAATTPTAFHDNPDYTRFDMAVDAALGVDASKRYDQEFFLHDSAATIVVPLLVTPTVTWRPNLATQSDASSASQDNGDYQITWIDKPFGPGELFRLDFSNPQTSVNAIVASLNARQTATTGAVDTATARALTQGLGVPVDTSQLVAVKLPFRVRNLSYGRTVTVAMRKRPTGGNNSTVLVGCVGSQCVQTNGLAQDTLRVPVPVNVWVPGDTLFFIETVNGTPQVTFSRAVLGCDQSAYTRLSCNPVYPGGRGSSTYLGDAPGEVEHVRYFVPVSPASVFTLTATAPLRGALLLGNGNAVASGLAAVRAVPNPYVMSTPYPNSGLMFTHVPPSGTLHIYTVSGQFVQQITWDETSPNVLMQLGGDGDLVWNLRSREGNFVNSGLYLFVITGKDATGKSVGSRNGKFVIIR